jgi:hypothetical protein
MTWRINPNGIGPSEKMTGVPPRRVDPSARKYLRANLPSHGFGADRRSGATQAGAIFAGGFEYQINCDGHRNDQGRQP